MKTIQLTALVCLNTMAGICFAQDSKFATSAKPEDVNTADSTGLAGDHFSLQGALDLFKTSTSLEDFEKKLNAESNNVNNLDLNGDGDIDYVRVVDNKKDSAHAIILQVPVSETESQDVAVIEIEKNGKESALVQIIGDDELYADNTIVEPFEDKESGEPSEAKKGPSAPNMHPPFHVVVNCWGWPCVRFVYAPIYVIWVSPWYWHHYPNYWHPWHPYPWRYHYSHCYHYHNYYHPVVKHRVVYAHRNVYAPQRRTSPTVQSRNRVAHDNYRARTVNNAPRNNNNITKPTNGRQTVNPNNSSAPRNRSGNPNNNTTRAPKQQVQKAPRSSGGSGGRQGGGGGRSGGSKGGGGGRKR